MMLKKITEDILYAGVDDKTIDLFESQYNVPNGVSYNSYVILDEKVVVMDTVDKRATNDWIRNLERILGERKPDYLVVSHMEPDHAGSLQILAERYPEMQLIGNAKTFAMMKQFFNLNFENRCVIVKEGDEISFGAHTLQFVMAPMVHWPEVMVSYDKLDKVLFSADGFGTFGALDSDANWEEEARRYYINICGKYGAPVQALLKKAGTLDIQIICPLHGPVLKENLQYYLEKYHMWSSYQPEEDAILIAFASIHGNTREAAFKMAEILKKENKKVVLRDLSREDMSVVIAEAFKYSKLILACATYDSGLFPCMEDFLRHLKAKNYQKRSVVLVENGSWAPQAGKQMKEIIEECKDMKLIEPIITIKSSWKEENQHQFEQVIKDL